MAKGDTQTQNQNQFQVGATSNAFDTNQNQTTGASTNSATGPWDPAKPLLNQLLDKYRGLNTDVTSQQADAAKAVSEGASGIPQAGSMAWDATKKLFSTDTTPQVGMLSNALSDYQKNINKTASGAELDPYATPGFSDALNTMSNDITNRVKGVYAGSGRDPSGAGSFSKALGRGLTEGISPVIAQQFNTNKTNQLQAARSLLDATGGTAGAITQQGQVPLTNISQGIGLLPGVNQAFTAPGVAQAGAADYAQNMPFGNLSKLLAPALQLGGAGTQTTGTTAGTSSTAGSGTSSGASQNFGQGTGTTTQNQSLLSNILGGLSGGVGLLSLLSDREVKSDIRKVGKLNDGQNIYRFRYKGAGPRMHIGLMADEVKKHAPGAVTKVGGLHAVDYAKATNRAAGREMSNMEAEAA